MTEEKTKKCCKAPFFVLILFILFTLYVAFFLTANTTNENGVVVDVNTEESIENSINENQEKISEEKENIISYFFNPNDEEGTVFSGLLNYGEENDIEIEYNNNYSFGVFIESIAGIKNGDEGKYWQYYVNDILGDVSADNKILQEEDNVEWRFEKVPF